MKQSQYIIGRTAPADIIPNGPGYDTLSRRHASITKSSRGSGYYYVSDLDSTNGTFVYRNGSWVRITTAEVHETEDIRFGRFNTTLEALLNKTIVVKQADITDIIRPEGVWERDPHTGEIRFRPLW